MIEYTRQVRATAALLERAKDRLEKQHATFPERGGRREVVKAAIAAVDAAREAVLEIDGRTLSPLEQSGGRTCLPGCGVEQRVRLAVWPRNGVQVNVPLLRAHSSGLPEVSVGRADSKRTLGFTVSRAGDFKLLAAFVLDRLQVRGLRDHLNYQLRRLTITKAERREVMRTKAILRRTRAAVRLIDRCARVQRS